MHYSMTFHSGDGSHKVRSALACESPSPTRPLPRNTHSPLALVCVTSNLPFLAVSLVFLLCIPRSCGAFELTSPQFLPLQRFSKFPVSQPGVRNQQLTVG